MNPLRGLVTARALRRSGLPQMWAVRYPALRGPAASSAAVAHVVGAVNTMAPPYRIGVGVLLHMLPTAFMLATGHRARSATPEVLERGVTRLSRLPGVAPVLRVLDVLALYGGLDGAAGPGKTVAETLPP